MLKEILHKLYTIEHIPSHPLMKVKLNSIISDSARCGDEYIEVFAKYISYDPSLTIEFLKIANAESFGLKNKISSICDSLHILDDDLIKLVISQHPVIPDLRVYHTNLASEFLILLKHSIEVHIIVQYILDIVLKDRNNIDNLREDILTASTLHDIGLFFLLIYFPNNYIEMINRIRESEMGQKIQKKKSPLIPDHSLVGSVLCEFWNLPAFIRNLISFHHYPWAVDERWRMGCEILYLADTISSYFYEIFHFDDVYTIDEHIIMRRKALEIINKFEIDITTIADISVQSLMQIDKLNIDFGL